jgi:hypothetical protein
VTFGLSIDHGHDSLTQDQIIFYNQQFDHVHIVGSVLQAVHRHSLSNNWKFNQWAQPAVKGGVAMRISRNDWRGFIFQYLWSSEVTNGVNGSAC